MALDDVDGTTDDEVVADETIESTDGGTDSGTSDDSGQGAAPDALDAPDATEGDESSSDDDAAGGEESPSADDVLSYIRQRGYEVGEGFDSPQLIDGLLQTWEQNKQLQAELQRVQQEAAQRAQYQEQYQQPAQQPQEPVYQAPQWGADAQVMQIGNTQLFGVRQDPVLRDAIDALLKQVPLPENAAEHLTRDDDGRIVLAPGGDPAVLRQYQAYQASASRLQKLQNINPLAVDEARYVLTPGYQRQEQTLLAIEQERQERNQALQRQAVATELQRERWMWTGPEQKEPSIWLKPVADAMDLLEKNGLPFQSVGQFGRYMGRTLQQAYEYGVQAAQAANSNPNVATPAAGQAATGGKAVHPARQLAMSRKTVPMGKTARPGSTGRVEAETNPFDDLRAKLRANEVE